MKCKVCGTAIDLQRHHISYDPEIIEILCVKHHQGIHGHGVGKAIGTKTENFGLIHHGRTRDQIEPQYIGTDYFAFYHKPCTLENTHEGQCEIVAILIDHQGRTVFNLKCKNCGFIDALKTVTDFNRYHISPKHAKNINKYRWDNA